MAIAKPRKIPAKKTPKGVVNPSTPAPPATVGKSAFAVKEWDGAATGFKSIIYGRSGMGKTTLLSQLDPVFIGLDDGGRKLKSPLTNKPLRFVDGISTFEDVRECLHSFNLFEGEKDVVIDTVTALQHYAEQYMFANIRHDKGHAVDRIEDYGYKAGYRHLYDTMYSILTDCDELVRRGLNVHLIAQLAATSRPHPGGEDYLEDAPNLQHPKNSVRDAYCEWADNIFFIDYSQIATSNKKASSDNQRVVNVQPQVHFIAKSRTLHEPAVTFEDAKDTTLWQFLLPDRFPSE